MTTGLKEFAKSSLKVATGIFLAGLALVAAVALFAWAHDAYQRQEAKPYEAIKGWEVDLKEDLGFDLRAKTKVVSGTLLVSVKTVGYPPYLSDPRNRNEHIIVHFLDRDGFKVFSKAMKLSEFSRIVGADGKEIGLDNQFDQSIDIEKYGRFSEMAVEWTLQTKALPNPPPDTHSAPRVLDHCAPKLSKEERLKRLAQHGTVRETGPGAYSAGRKSVDFFSDGTLLNCQ